MKVIRLLLPVTAALLFAPSASASAADCPGADLTPDAAAPVAIRAAVVCLTNDQRAQNGLTALVVEGHLEAAAQAYSQELVDQRFFGHVAPDGSGLADRLRAYVDWTDLGENLAWGEQALATPRTIVNAWMASPEHRANLLSAAFAEVGIGVTSGTPVGSTGPGGTYVAEYGARTFDAAVPDTAATAPDAVPAKARVRPSARRHSTSRKRAPRRGRGRAAQRAKRSVRAHARPRAARSHPSRSRSAASVLQKAKSS
jgi:hypothetical protein